MKIIDINDLVKMEFPIEDFFALAVDTASKVDLIGTSKVTSQARASRAVMIKPLLKDIGVKAIKLSTWENSLLLYFGDLFLQLHRVFETAIEEVGGDQALQGFFTCLMLFVKQRAVKLNYEKEAALAFWRKGFGEGDEEIIEGLFKQARVKGNQKMGGELLALQQLLTLVADAMKLEDFSIELQEASMGLVLDFLAKHNLSRNFGKV